MSQGARMRVTVDTSGLERRLSGEAFRKAQEAFAKRVAFDTRDYVPVDSGILRDSEPENSHYETGMIIWDTPYAHYVYNLDGVRTVINPNATPHWCETAKQRHLEDWKALAVRLLGGE
jgi:hypothetical protein